MQNTFSQNGKEWERLKKVLERISYGEVTIVMQGSRPVRVELAVKNIKLDGDERDFEQGLKTIAL